MGSAPKTTIKKINHCAISKLEKGEFPPFGLFDEDIYYLSIEGDGFLKQMVRLIMGSLFAVGREKISTDDLRDFLTRKKNRKHFSVAPPDGLYLYRVDLESRS